MNDQKFPASFEQRMRNVLGEEWENFALAHTRNSPVSIRANTRKFSSLVYQDRIPWTASGFYLNERPIFTLDPIFHGGAYYVQEASSMFLEQAILQTINNDAALNVLDLCAAPGGKSTHLLSLISKESLLVSNEVIRSRAPILEENIQKWGNLNAVISNNDPKDFQKLGPFFDVIVVDAPCSGEGLFRKDPDAMNEWSNDSVLLCANRQRRILKDIWPTLKRDGILIYSTCTYSENENEEVLQWLNEAEDVEFLRLKLDPQWGVIEVSKENVLGYRLFPHRVRGEGLFMSVMRKLSGDDIRLKAKKLFAPPPKKSSEEIRTWLNHPDDKLLVIRNDELSALPANKVIEIEYLTNNLHLISCGTRIATRKYDKHIPDHALALSQEVNTGNFNTIDLSASEALRYLRKETIEKDTSEKGFALVQFARLNLGWVNVLDTRINNLYPAEWRIRMQDRKS